jgi:ubiquinone/menaquinone biosynthesis C-methylase UbiE
VQLFSTLAGKLRRARIRLLMRSALSGGILYRLLSRSATGRFSDERAPGWDHMVGEHAHKWFDPLDAALDTRPDSWTPLGVLDLGGGTGRGGYHLAERYPTADVSVVDISPGMLAFGAQRGERESLPPVSFIAGDSTAIPIRSSSMQLAFVLNAPVNPREMARVLEPGGIVVLAFTYGQHTPMYLDERTARAALTQAGFADIRSGAAGEGSWVLGVLKGSES